MELPVFQTAVRCSVAMARRPTVAATSQSLSRILQQRPHLHAVRRQHLSTTSRLLEIPRSSRPPLSSTTRPAVQMAPLGNDSTMQQQTTTTAAATAAAATPPAAVATKWPVRELPAYPPLDLAKDSRNPPKSDRLPLEDSDWSLGPLASSFEEMSRMKPEEKPMRLVPSTGRSIYVSWSMDPSRAFNTMNVLCRHNSVQADSRRQRFHERPGLKRKRLRMSRWRKRFRDGFQAAASRVRQLAKQGW